MMSFVPENPESQILALIARTTLDETATARLRTLLGGPVNWERLYRMALRHGVVALLYRHLSKIQPNACPPAWRERFAAEARVLAVNNLQQTQELLRVVTYLEEEGVPVISFKGPLLAALIYQDPSARVYVDLDLLVRREDFARARALIEALGYRAYRPIRPGEEEAFLKTQLGFEFVHESGLFVIELHWAFFYTIYDLPLDPQAIWSRHRQITFAGRSIRTLGPEDLLIYLVIHGNKHRWLKLNWVADVAELLRTYPELDWHFVLAQAQQLGVLRILEIGLILAEEVLAAPIPGMLQKQLGQARTARRMAHRVAHQWIFQDESDRTAFWPMFWYHFRERERWRHRWGYLRHHLKLALTPTEKDRAFFRLPRSLVLLYVFLRPVRILLERFQPGLKS
jgi:hypothetical protein